MITLGDAVVFLRANAGGLNNELDSAERSTRGWASRLGGSVATLAGGAVLAGATAAAGAIVGIGAAAFDMAAQVDAAEARIRSQLGLTVEDAEAYGEAIKSVYANNWGESIEDVGEALVTVRQGMHDLYRPSAEELGQLTEYALGLRDAFDVDVAESTRAANQIMTQFGASGEEAFEIIAAGMQFGVNSTDDLLDTLDEYSADFADLGFTADETLSMLNAGLQSGIYNTDKIGDTFREFKINLMDVGRLEAIEGLNEDLDETVRTFRRGEITGVDAFSQIRRELLDMEDPVARHNIGVALMGSMWEDLGEEAILSMDTMSDSLTDNRDSLGALGEQSQTIGQRMQGVWRRLQVAIEPVGEAIVGLVEQAMPHIEQAAAWLGENLPAVIAIVVEHLQGVGSVLGGEVIPRIGEFVGWFINEGMPAVVAFVTGTLLPAIQSVGDWWGANVQPVIDAVIGWIVGEALPAVVTFVSEQLIPGVQAFVTWFGENIAPVVASVVGFIVNEALPAIVSFVRDQLIPGIQTFAAWFREHWWPAIEAVVGFLVEAFRQIVTFAQTHLVPFIEQAWQDIQDTIERVVGFIEDVIVPIIEGIFGAVTGIFQGFTALFQGDFDAFGEGLATAWDSIWTGIRTAFENVVGGLLEAVGNLVQNIINAFLNVDWGGIGRGLIDGITNGISGAASSVGNALSNAANGALSWVQGALGIQSPSKVAAELIGQPLGEGIAAGIEDATGSIASAMDGAVGLPNLRGGGAAGLGGGTVIHVGGIHFNGQGAPSTPAEADRSAQMFVSALRAKGLAV